MLKRGLQLVVCSLFLGLLFTQISRAQSVNNFVIDSFDSDYYITKDANNVSQLKVTEVIKATFPDYNQNHGIERAIPDSYKDNSLNLKIVSISNGQGEPWRYLSSKQNGNLVLRIGDPNAYVHGQQTYVITYTERDVMTFYQDHDEWYWNINGTQWQQPFIQTSATIHIPTDIAAHLKTDMQCFTGAYGSRQSNCTITKSEGQDGAVVRIEADGTLSGGENMSFVLGFTSSTFTKYTLSPLLRGLLIGGLVMCWLILPLLTLIIMWHKWAKIGKDPKGRGVIVPEYTPPVALNPILSDIILNQKMSNRSISALMLDLCVNGYCRLEEKGEGKDSTYKLKLLKSVDQLDEQYKQVAVMLFGTGATIGTHANLTKGNGAFYKSIGPITNTANQTVVAQGYFSNNPKKVKGAYFGWGLVLLILGMVAVFFSRQALLFTGGLGFCGVIVFIFTPFMPAHTQKGIETKEYLLGLKMYMQLAEAERIQFLQSPENAQRVPIDTSDTSQVVKLYERLLPYAMLLGIEKEWAKQFAGMYTTPPDWYSGNGTFNAMLFTNTINGFTTTANNSFRAPQSSGSSGFGGGFSGGGGGGGGGGGW